MVPLAHSVVRGSGAVGVPVVVVHRRCSSLGALLSFMSLLGGRWRSLGSRLLGAGRRCFFACGYRGVGRLSSFWAAGLVRGGVGCVT